MEIGINRSIGGRHFGEDLTVNGGPTGKLITCGQFGLFLKDVQIGSHGNKRGEQRLTLVVNIIAGSVSDAVKVLKAECYIHLGCQCSGRNTIHDYIERGLRCRNIHTFQYPIDHLLDDRFGTICNTCGFINHTVTLVSLGKGTVHQLIGEQRKLCLNVIDDLIKLLFIFGSLLQSKVVKLIRTMLHQNAVDIVTNLFGNLFNYSFHQINTFSAVKNLLQRHLRKVDIHFAFDCIKNSLQSRTLFGTVNKVISFDCKRIYKRDNISSKNIAQLIANTFYRGITLDRDMKQVVQAHVTVCSTKLFVNLCQYSMNIAYIDCLIIELGGLDRTKHLQQLTVSEFILHKCDHFVTTHVGNAHDLLFQIVIKLIIVKHLGINLSKYPGDVYIQNNRICGNFQFINISIDQYLQLCGNLLQTGKVACENQLKGHALALSHGVRCGAVHSVIKINRKRKNLAILHGGNILQRRKNILKRAQQLLGIDHEIAVGILGCNLVTVDCQAVNIDQHMVKDHSQQGNQLILQMCMPCKLDDLIVINVSKDQINADDLHQLVDIHFAKQQIHFDNRLKLIGGDLFDSCNQIDITDQTGDINIIFGNLISTDQCNRLIKTDQTECLDGIYIVHQLVIVKRQQSFLCRLDIDHGLNGDGTLLHHFLYFFRVDDIIDFNRVLVDKFLYLIGSLLGVDHIVNGDLFLGN